MYSLFTYIVISAKVRRLTMSKEAEIRLTYGRMTDITGT